MSKTDMKVRVILQEKIATDPAHDAGHKGGRAAVDGERSAQDKLASTVYGRRTRYQTHAVNARSVDHAQTYRYRYHIGRIIIAVLALALITLGTGYLIRQLFFAPSVIPVSAVSTLIPSSSDEMLSVDSDTDVLSPTGVELFEKPEPVAAPSDAERSKASLPKASVSVTSITVQSLVSDADGIVNSSSSISDSLFDTPKEPQADQVAPSKPQAVEPEQKNMSTQAVEPQAAKPSSQAKNSVQDVPEDLRAPPAQESTVTPKKPIESPAKAVTEPTLQTPLQDQRAVTQALVPVTSEWQASLENTPPSATSFELAVPEVTRALLTSKVVNLEPINDLEPLILFSDQEDVKYLYFYTQINNAKDKVYFYNWYFEGTLSARVKVSIKGNRWRSYSSKQILSSEKGDWRVELVLEGGQEAVAERTFIVR